MTDKPQWQPRVFGEIAVFRNPRNRATYLADVAVRDPWRGLVWEPLANDDPRAIAAIARAHSPRTSHRSEELADEC